MNKYPEFWAAFLNGLPIGVLLAGFIFSILGVTLNALLKTTARDPNSDRTPLEFSWKFFWSDNIVRLLRSGLITVIVIFLSIRFFKELTGASNEFLMLYCVGVGLGIDVAVAKLKKKANIDEVGKP